MSVTARPFRHLCPEADLRDAMDDGEFWEHVFGLGPDTEDDSDVPTTAQRAPCPACGERGPCAYDDQGRALIHATQEGDE